MEYLQQNLQPDSEPVIHISELPDGHIRSVAEPVQDLEQVELAIPGFREVFDSAYSRIAYLLQSDPDFSPPAIYLCDDESFDRLVGRSLDRSNPGATNDTSYDALSNVIYIASSKIRSRIADGGLDAEKVERQLTGELIHSGITRFNRGGRELQIGMQRMRYVDPIPRQSQGGGLYFWHIEEPSADEIATAGNRSGIVESNFEPEDINTTRNLIELLVRMHYSAEEFNPQGNDLLFGLEFKRRGRVKDISPIGIIQKQHLRELYDITKKPLTKRIYDALQTGTAKSVQDELVKPLDALRRKHHTKLARSIERYDGLQVTPELISESLIPTVKRVVVSLPLQNLEINDQNSILPFDDDRYWYNHRLN